MHSPRLALTLALLASLTACQCAPLSVDETSIQVRSGGNRLPSWRPLTIVAGPRIIPLCSS